MTTSMPHDPRDVLEFWFGPTPLDAAGANAREGLWFGGSAETDEIIRSRFEPLVEAAARGELAAWKREPRSALALVVLLDQLSRNLWRGTARAFAQDPLAIATAREAIAAGHLARLPLIEQAFLILPFEHSEAIADQRECVRLSEEILRAAPASWRSLFESYLAFARQHLDLIERFGRFPHRNECLGRESTAAETAYLRGGAETYRQSAKQTPTATNEG